MLTRLGEVEQLFRYPVKSMAGESLGAAELGWHGVDGDRRLAFRRVDDRGGFPWLTATKLPDLLRFTPRRRGASPDAALPTHVLTPDGREHSLYGEALAAEVERLHGSPVEMMHLDRGIFDEASVSLISSATVGELARLADRLPDVRRFRPNILISLLRPVPFEEDGWVEGVLRFGDGDDGAAIGITNRDERCSMVNYDPDSAAADPQVLRAIVQARGNKAGVYGTVMRRGRIEVGQPIYFEPGAAPRERL